jgi:hypothetical protein
MKSLPFNLNGAQIIDLPEIRAPLPNNKIYEGVSNSEAGFNPSLVCKTRRIHVRG